MKKFNQFDIDSLIERIDQAAATYASYEKIATAAKIRPETLWKIRTKKHDPKTQTARAIARALEELKMRKPTEN